MTPRVVQGTRPGGRSARVRAAVLAATMEELASHGFAALAIDEVALRAGVHKTTIYRRWKDRTGLILDVMMEYASVGDPIPDSGDLATDLRALARFAVDILSDPTKQALLSTLVSDAARVPEIADIKHRFLADHMTHARPAVTQAIERGEIPEDTDCDELIRTLFAPIYLRVLITDQPVDDAVITRAVNVTLAAVRAGALRRVQFRP